MRRMKTEVAMRNRDFLRDKRMLVKHLSDSSVGRAPAYESGVRWFKFCSSKFVSVQRQFILNLPSQFPLRFTIKYLFPVKLKITIFMMRI